MPKTKPRDRIGAPNWRDRMKWLMDRPVEREAYLRACTTKHLMRLAKEFPALRRADDMLTILEERRASAAEASRRKAETRTARAQRGLPIGGGDLQKARLRRKCPICKAERPQDQFSNIEAPGIRVSDPSLFSCNSCTDSASNEYPWIQRFPQGSECVYLIHASGLWKIGYTTDLANRVASLRAMNAAPIKLEFAWRGSRFIESRFHDMMARYRHHGEWFDLPPDKVERLKKTKSSSITRNMRQRVAMPTVNGVAAPKKLRG